MLGLFSTATPSHPRASPGWRGCALGFASLVGLPEVLFAVLWARVLIGEAMTAVQALGAAVVLAGLILARPR